MDFVNHTRFPALAFQGAGPGGERFWVVVLRQTLVLGEGGFGSAPGIVPEFAPEQSPLCPVEVFSGEANRSSLLAESDFCPWKPRCDVLVDATAHAPGGREARSWRVRLRVRRPGGGCVVDKELVVSGPGWFRRRSLLVRGLWFLVAVGTLGLVRRNPWKRTRPGRVCRVPIRYEEAFGGEAKVLVSERGAGRVPKRVWLGDRGELRRVLADTGEDRPLAWAAWAANPVGKGYAQNWSVRAGRPKAIPAPQVEAPGCQVGAWQFRQVLRGRGGGDPALLPQGFGLLSRGWSPRCLEVGTVAGTLEAGRALPEDFGFEVWNGAPPDQQVAYLEGDEVLELTNLCAPAMPGAREDDQGDTVLSLALPGHLPYVLARFGTGEMVPLPMNLDTLNLDVEGRRLVLVWRQVVPVEPEVPVLEARMVRAEAKEAFLERNGVKGTWGTRGACGLSLQGGGRG